MQRMRNEPAQEKAPAATEGARYYSAGEREQDSPALRYVHEALRAKPLAPYPIMYGRFLNNFLTHSQGKRCEIGLVYNVESVASMILYMPCTA